MKQKTPIPTAGVPELLRLPAGIPLSDGAQVQQLSPLPLWSGLLDSSGRENCSSWMDAGIESTPLSGYAGKGRETRLEQSVVTRNAPKGSLLTPAPLGTPAALLPAPLKPFHGVQSGALWPARRIISVLFSALETLTPGALSRKGGKEGR